MWSAELHIQYGRQSIYRPYLDYGAWPIIVFTVVRRRDY